MVLERYDDAVIRAVTSPLTGIQRTCKFPPSIAEFVEFVDEHVRRSTFASNYDQRSREQLREREDIEAKAEPPEERQQTTQRILREMKEAFAAKNNEPHNVFVPTFAPQYPEMLKLGGRPGVSLKDKNRSGVWVPLSWLQGQTRAKQDTWRRFSDDDLRAQYPSREAS